MEYNSINKSGYSAINLDFNIFLDILINYIYAKSEIKDLLGKSYALIL